MEKDEYFKQLITIPAAETCFDELIAKAKDYALMHGAGIRSRENFNPDVLQFVPFTLTPSPFPRQEFEKVVDLQATWNELMHAVANDDEFLRKTLSSTIKVDDFTAKLYEIYENTRPHKGSISLALTRSDYLPHCFESNALKLVEINTIASSFGALTPIIRQVHQYILGEVNQGSKTKDLPENNCLKGLADGIIRAWEMYGSRNAVVLFVVEEVTYNICDQRILEYEIRKSNVRVIRKTLGEIQIEGDLNKDSELLVDGELVSVVYFRAGYEPSHYPSNVQWKARALIEKSRAVKCPNISYHLAGTKKVQQVLAHPETLRRFFTDEAKIQAIKSVCTGIYSLDKDDDNEAIVKEAKTHPDKFVLKPQREGGGNNVYGKDIPKALEELSADELSAYILMDRICPPLARGYILRPGTQISTQPSDLISELGIFGVVIGTKEKILYNAQVGHNFRAKLAASNETGVNAGLGALDSPYLFD